MRADYQDWLKAQEYSENTITAQLHRVGKVEHVYGSLDEIYAKGGYDDLIGELTYSVQDERLGKANPSRIPFEGNIRNNLQSYKNAVVRYRKFMLGDSSLGEDGASASMAVAEVPSPFRPRNSASLSSETCKRRSGERFICLTQA